ncbi:unnamed protein product [Agarophyton chilense]
MNQSPDAAAKAASPAPKVATPTDPLTSSSTSTHSDTVAPEPVAPNQAASLSNTPPCQLSAENSRESFAEPSNSASRTPSSQSEDGDTVVDDPPTKHPISPAAVVQPPPTTLNVIHSVPNPSSVPPLSPLSDVTAPTPRSGLFSIFSPRNDKSMSPLRRLFSPRWFSSAPVDHQTESTVTTAPRRRNLACCFVRPQTLDESLPDFDYVEQIRHLEPTYEPEPPLLPDPSQHAQDKICLVLDLDETLVHSSFTPLPSADFEIPLDMQGETHTVYVKKRPGVDKFLKKASEWFEIVIFTASLALYANPVVDLLDPHNLVELRLYREHCVLIGGCYVKDIAKLGRDLRRTVIIDNSPLSYVLQPENAIPISAFFTDEDDRELEKTLDLLEQARNLEDIRKALT